VQIISVSKLNLTRRHKVIRLLLIFLQICGNHDARDDAICDIIFKSLLILKECIIHVLAYKFGKYFTLIPISVGPLCYLVD